MAAQGRPSVPGTRAAPGAASRPTGHRVDKHAAGRPAHRMALVLPLVSRAVDRGELPAGTDAEELIKHVGAPLYYRILVLDEPVTAEAADLAAAVTALPPAPACSSPGTSDRTVSEHRTPHDQLRPGGGVGLAGGGDGEAGGLVEPSRSAPQLRARALARRPGRPGTPPRPRCRAPPRTR